MRHRRRSFAPGSFQPATDLANKHDLQNIACRRRDGVAVSRGGFRRRGRSTNACVKLCPSARCQRTKIRAAVIKVIGTQGDRVEVAVAGAVLAVARINSTMNQTGRGAHAGEASRIAPAMATTIVSEPVFRLCTPSACSTSIAPRIAPSPGITGKSSMRWTSGRTRPAHSCRIRPERPGIGRDRPGAER